MDAIMILVRFFIWIGVNIAGVIMLIKAIRRKGAKRNAIIAFIVGLIAFITLGESSIKFNERHPSEPVSTSNAEAVPEIGTTPEPTEEPPPEPVGNNDNAILHREGHPTYYGSTAKAHEVWDDVEKGKISFADSNGSYSDSIILTMSGYRQDEHYEIIRNKSISRMQMTV